MRTTGIEPATYGLGNHRSTTELNPLFYVFLFLDLNQIKLFKIICFPNLYCCMKHKCDHPRTRTWNLMLRRHALYPLSQAANSTHLELQSSLCLMPFGLESLRNQGTLGLLPNALSLHL